MFHVREVTLQGVASFREASRVSLPERGIVLLTGPNGGGKTTLLRAVALGAFNEHPWGEAWRAGEGGIVTLATDRAYITRSRKAGKGARVMLEWEAPGGSSVAYETPTKAQEALERVLGSYELWRKTHVFTSEEASRFSTSTDLERKRLLEELLGLDRFDGAAERLRKEAADVNLRAMNADAQASTAAGTARDHAVRRGEALDALRGLPGGGKDAKALREEAAAAGKDGIVLKVDLDAILSELEDARQDVRDAEAAEAAAVRDAARVDKAACAACGQAIPEDVRLCAQAAAQRAKTATSAARQAAKARGEGLQEEAAELRAQLQAIGQRQQALLSTASSVESIDGTRTRLLQTAGAAEVREAESKAAEAKAREAALSLAAAHRELKGAELLLKTVRGRVLGRALRGIEAAANARLLRLQVESRVGAKAGKREALRVQLNETTEKKTGGQSEAIALLVERTETEKGAPRAYSSFSQGERRRVDVGLVLAMADVARAARGELSAGTLFFDEVFDALDADGADDVCSALAEMARDRAVVVATHSEALVSRLRPAAHYRAERSGLTRVTDERRK